MAETLVLGPPKTMVQNTIYAMPARTVFCIATQICEFALTTVTTDFVRVSASTTGFQSSYLFTRNTAATVSTIVVKAY